MKKLFYMFYWTDLYYDIKFGIMSIIKYFPIVWKMRNWDYVYLFEMQKFQLSILLKTLKQGHEIKKTRIPKQKNIQRCIVLLNNLIEDNYHERCGFDHNRINFKSIPDKNNPEITNFVNVHSNPQSYKEIRNIFNKSEKLQKQELKELFSILENGVLGWWD